MSIPVSSAAHAGEETLHICEETLCDIKWDVHASAYPQPIEIANKTSRSTIFDYMLYMFRAVRFLSEL